MIFSVAGFSQTAESTSKSSESKASCDKKGKPACCAHAEAAKGCDDGAAKSSAAVEGEAPKATITATEPKKDKKASSKTTNSGL